MTNNNLSRSQLSLPDRSFNMSLDTSQSPFTGYFESSIANPDLRWATVQKKNIGFDYAVLNGMFAGSFDWFRDDRYDIFIYGTDRSVPSYYGAYKTPDINKGKIKNTGFGEFDAKRFPIINVANRVMKEKGTLGAIFNASNEEAVRAFLNHQIPFLGIERIIHSCLDKQKSVINPTYEDLKEADLSTRLLVKQMIEKGEY